VPACAVEDEDGMGMGTGGDAAGDFREVGVHRLGVDGRQDQPCRGATCGADGPEDVGPLVAGIAGCAGSGAAPGPDAGERALLANARFILKPEFERPAPRGLGDRRRYRFGEVFLNAACAPGSLFGCCGRTESLR
jgi:hypothetical protein